jgi:hypothetical protein
MIEPEEVTETFTVIGVSVSDANCIEVVAAPFMQVAAECRRQVATLVIFIIVATHCGEVDQDLAPISKVEAGGIGVAERKEVHQSLHFTVLIFLPEQIGQFFDLQPRAGA